MSKYAAKNENEDQAETARYFMTTLADSLVQVMEQPDLPGSQRILDLLERYRAAGSPGPGVDWFVDLALPGPTGATVVARCSMTTARLLPCTTVGIPRPGCVTA